uniref:Uncharacterized protein n=1 Tax=Brachypodium sylvaticum TaxID=29664 RepID=C3TX86_BRASY|nr:unknown [Brachypodium sylvaticum]
MASAGVSSAIPPGLKKQLEAADKAFAGGDLKSAKMHADMAKALYPAVLDAQRAHAAYKVLHAANANAGNGNHYAVLGVAAPPNGRPTKESHDAVKASHKALCDLLGGADAKTATKTAAMAAALKLVNEAFAALTDIKKNEAASLRAPAGRPRLPPLRPVLQRPKASAAAPTRIAVVDSAVNTSDDQFFEQPAPEQKEVQGAGAAEEEEEDYYAGGRSRSGRVIPVVKY